MYTDIDIKTAELISGLKNYSVNFAESDRKDKRGGTDMLNSLEDIDIVDDICKIAKKYAPDYDINKIYEEYHK